MIIKLLYKLLLVCVVSMLLTLGYSGILMAGDGWVVGTSKGKDSTSSEEPYPSGSNVLGILEPSSEDCRLNPDLWQRKENGEACKNLKVAITTLDGTAPAGTTVPLATFLCIDELIAQATSKAEELECATTQQQNK